MTLLRGQHLKRTAASAITMLVILISGACASEPETKSEMKLETKPPSKAITPTVSDPPIPTKPKTPVGPLIDDERCRNICEDMRCDKNKHLHIYPTSPTRRFEQLLSITPHDDPERPTLLLQLADVHFGLARKHQYSLCETQRRCATLDAENRPPRKHQLCWAFVAHIHEDYKQEMAKALIVYRQVLQERPDFESLSHVLWYASIAHEELGQLDQALLLRRELLETFPNSPYIPVIMRDDAP